MATHPSSSSPSRWTDYLPESDIALGSLRTWKKDGEQLVVGRDAHGEVFALDNRCPHEGYPLTQGDLKDTTLTCCWHNWKFDVRSGACLKGGEAVRRFPVRIEAGMVQVDLAPPPQDEERSRLHRSLDEALSDNDLDRALRDSVRLLRTGYPVDQLLGDVAVHDARYAEYGATHALALASETRQILAHQGDAPVAQALAPLLELESDGNQRLPERQRPQPISGGSAAALRQAVESEDLERAEALVLGGYAEGRSRQEIEQWLFEVAADHFLSFGHGLIYLIKTRTLLDVLPSAYAPPLHASLLFYMGNATREDTLPYLRSYFGSLSDWESAFAAVLQRQPESTTPPVAVEEAVLDGTQPEAMQAVWDALQQGSAPSAVAQALVLAAARRLLRFDVQWDADPAVQEGWLFATHRMTFASAARLAQERFPSPRALRFLFQAAAFIHSGAPMDASPAPHDTLPRARSAPADQVYAAILRRDTDAALCGVAAGVRNGVVDAGLTRALQQSALDATLIRPIFRVHAIKTLLAGLEETAALAAHERHALPLLAAVRFLASPVREGRAAAAAHAATEWVEHGRMVRKLTQ